MPTFLKASLLFSVMLILYAHYASNSSLLTIALLFFSILLIIAIAAKSSNLDKRPTETGNTEHRPAFGSTFVDRDFSNPPHVFMKYGDSTDESRSHTIAILRLNHSINVNDGKKFSYLIGRNENGDEFTFLTGKVIYAVNMDNGRMIPDIEQFLKKW